MLTNNRGSIILTSIVARVTYLPSVPVLQTLKGAVPVASVPHQAVVASSNTTGHNSDVGVRGRSRGMQQGPQTSDTSRRVWQRLQRWNRGEAGDTGQQEGEYKI